MTGAQGKVYLRSYTGRGYNLIRPTEELLGTKELGALGNRLSAGGLLYDAVLMRLEQVDQNTRLAKARQDLTKLRLSPVQMQAATRLVQRERLSLLARPTTQSLLLDGSTWALTSFLSLDAVGAASIAGPAGLAWGTFSLIASSSENQARIQQTLQEERTKQARAQGYWQVPNGPTFIRQKGNF